jgi:hypothetical protein
MKVGKTAEDAEDASLPKLGCGMNLGMKVGKADEDSEDTSLPSEGSGDSFSVTCGSFQAPVAAVVGSPTGSVWDNRYLLIVSPITVPQNTITATAAMAILLLLLFIIVSICLVLTPNYS